MEYFIMILALVLFGGFYMFGMTLVGALISAGIIVCVVKNRCIETPPSLKCWQFYIPHICLVAGALMIPFAENKDTAFQGIIRGGVILFWMFLMTFIGEKKRRKLLESMPGVMAVITIFGFLFLLIPDPYKEWMWLAGRFCGVFQYANTMALALAVGVLILLKKPENPDEKRKPVKAVLLVILLAGLLATGTRSILLLMVLYLLYKVIRNSEERKTAVILVLSIVGASILAFAASAILDNENLLQNVGRLATIFKYNSTFWGRILYWRDAVLYLLKHPQGLGYLGYYNALGLFQTGNYQTMFVHNDLLQLGLDFGIVPMLLFVYYLYYQLRHGTQDIFSKELLVFMGLSGLCDFHFQYGFILMLAVLFLDLGGTLTSENKAKSRAENPAKKVALLACNFALFTYFTIAFFALKIGNTDLTLAMMGASSEALETRLMSVSSLEEAEEILNDLDIIKKHSFAAENTRVYLALMDGDEKAVYDHMDKALSLDPYNEYLYENYAELYPAAEDFLKEKSEKQKEKTSSLAYKLRDKPYFYDGK